MRAILVRVLWIPFMAVLTAIDMMRAVEEGLLHEIALIGLPRRGRGPASPLALLGRGGVGRGQLLELGDIEMTGGALAGLGRAGSSCAQKQREECAAACQPTRPSTNAHDIHEDTSNQPFMTPRLPLCQTDTITRPFEEVGREQPAFQPRRTWLCPTVSCNCGP